ncbi:MAG: hypothetical protein IJT68_08645 [Lentisphaeria bacterium]|nr:hypothetical protein [Lentisphaeria bacterium]
MVITESIQKAIQSAIDKCGSLLSFSRSVGVSHTTVAYWLNGRTRKINSTVWDNLHPLIQEYLEPGGKGESVYPSEPVAAGSPAYVLHEKHAGRYGTMQNAPAPLLQLDALKDFDPQIDSIEEIIRKKSKRVVMFTSPVQTGFFAVEVDKKRSGFFPEGTRLLLRGLDAPCDGDTVLVKLRDKTDYLFAVYTRKDEDVSLTPLQDNAAELRIPRADFHNVCCWIVPIREAVQVF